MCQNVKIINEIISLFLVLVVVGHSPKLVLSFSTMAVLTQSSSRGYTFPVNKNTLKEDVYIYRDLLCNFPRFVDTHKHSHIETRSKALLETLSLTVMRAWHAFCHCGQSADLGSYTIWSKGMAWNSFERWLRACMDIWWPLCYSSLGKHKKAGTVEGALEIWRV